MSAAAMTERRLIERAQAEGLLPPEARAAWQDEAGPSWIITVLSFIGAQLVVLPFMGFLGLLASRFFFQPPGAVVRAAVLIGGAALLLRARPAMFVTQLAFSALLAGLALLAIGFEGALHNPQLLTILLVLLGSACWAFWLPARRWRWCCGRWARATPPTTGRGGSGASAPSR